MSTGPWIRHSSKVVYENDWIRVRHDDVTTPRGTPGIYGVVETAPAIGVVPLDDELHTWLVGQFRYAVGTYTWEIPEGGGRPEEAVEDGARRELREETGLRAARLTPLGTMQTSNCFTDEIAHLFLAEQLTPGRSDPDPTEELEVRRLPFSKACDMARTGAIQDAMSIVALYRAEAVLEERGLLRG